MAKQARPFVDRIRTIIPTDSPRPEGGFSVLAMLEGGTVVDIAALAVAAGDLLRVTPQRFGVIVERF